MTLRSYEIITRLRAPNVTGPDGATIPGSWSTVAEVDLLKASYLGDLQPLGSTEEIVGQQRTESTHKAYLPAGADVLATDRLRVGGVDYQVDGDPAHHRLRGSEHHIEAFCFVVRGG